MTGSSPSSTMDHMRPPPSTSRFAATVIAAVLTSAALAACTGAPSDPEATPDETAISATSTESPTPDDEDAAVRIVAATEGAAPVEVLAADTAEAAAFAASAALIAEAPVVVLATASDAAAVTSATAAATDLGFPVLPAPIPAPSASPSTSPDPSATPTTDPAPTTPTATPVPSGAPSSDVLASELERLGTHTLLAVDSAAADAADAAAALAQAGDVEIEVVTNPDELPEIQRAEPQPTTAVLTTGLPTDALALATAAAAGATVVTAPTGDPRASADAVTALAATPPTRTLALGAAFGTAEVLTPRLATAATGVQLPGGGQLVLADRRYVALYGHPGTPSLGLLGEQPLGEAVPRAQKLARDYDAVSDLPVIPTFEIITTVASAGAGADGDYSNEVDPSVLEPWIQEAGEAGIYVLLDLQPGRSDFLSQAQQYESLLAYPNVGLALDPEWRLGPDERHLAQIGSVTAAEVNATSAWLAELTRSRALPQKMLVLHQFTTSMISERETLDTSHDELAVVIHADGNGGPGAKLATWNKLRENAPTGVTFAWKNFIDEDTPTFTPAETMAIEPTPVLVSYQ